MKETTEMIEIYWNEVFGAYKVGERKFFIPEFPEPLMSPHFGVRNLIQEKPLVPATLTNPVFQLCYFYPNSYRPAQSALPFPIKCEPLSAVLNRPEIWDFHQQQYPQAYLFLRRLLPFLTLGSSPSPHFHLWMEDPENGRIIASAFAGESSSIVFFFQLAIDLNWRQKHLGRSFFEHSRQQFASKKIFYWTTHPYFHLGADVVKSYTLLKEK